MFKLNGLLPLSAYIKGYVKLLLDFVLGQALSGSNSS